MLNAYNVIFAAFLIVCGRLADLIGRRRTFVTGIVIFALSSAICGAAGSVNVLIVGRVIQTFGAALLVPASLALVVNAFPIERRAHAIGMWGSAAAIAARLGPPLGGALVELGGWRLGVWVNLPIGLGAAVVARACLVESRAQGRRRFRCAVPPARRRSRAAHPRHRSGTGLGLDDRRRHWDAGRFGGRLSAVRGRSARHPSPLLDPVLLRTRAFAVTNLASLTAGIRVLVLLTNILWLQYVWGYSVLAAGGALVPGAVVAAVTAAVVGPLAERHGHRYIVVPGAIVWALAYVWYFERVGPHPDFLGVWLPGQALSGIGAGAVLPILASAALGVVPGGRFATASAVVTSSRQLGGVVGVALLVVIIGVPTPGGIADAVRERWILSIACFGATALVSMTMGRVVSTDERPGRRGRGWPRRPCADPRQPTGAISRTRAGGRSADQAPAESARGAAQQGASNARRSRYPAGRAGRHLVDH